MSETMQAGRELDARVAVEVMGWQITHRGRRVIPGSDYGWRPTGHRGAPGSPEMSGFKGRADAMRWIAVVCPHYSTYIASAWEVVEKLRARFPTIHISLGAPNDRWYCSFFGNVNDKGSALEADTAPLAICLAALKAVATPTPTEETPR